VHGGAASLTSGLVGWHMSMSWVEWRTLVVAAFISNGAIRFVQYFVNNPLPPTEDTGFVDQSGKVITNPPPVMSINPLSKVVPLSTTPPPVNP